MNTDKNPHEKPMLYLYLSGIILLILLNALVFPKIRQPKVVDISYDEFVSVIDEREVDKVTQDMDAIFFTKKANRTPSTASASGTIRI